MSPISIVTAFVVLILVVPAESRADIEPRTNKDSVYTLYQSGTGEFSQMRIHLATFDTALGAEYNQSNCEIVRNMFQNQLGAKAGYWCEKGYFRKKNE